MIEWHNPKRETELSVLQTIGVIALCIPLIFVWTIAFIGYVIYDWIKNK